MDNNFRAESNYELSKTRGPGTSVYSGKGAACHVFGALFGQPFARCFPMVTTPTAKQHQNRHLSTMHERPEERMRVDVERTW